MLAASGLPAVFAANLNFARTVGGGEEWALMAPFAGLHFLLLFSYAVA